ncbi:MAG: helix-turn-helix domain-containing protein [Tsuneonella sp.]
MVEYRSVTSEYGVTVHFAAPSPELRPYVTAYYLAEVGSSAAPAVEDYLHPEWGNVRISDVETIEGAIGPEPLRPIGRAVATGPTSIAPHFRVKPGRFWGIGLMPLGWARFVGCRASEMADRYVDAFADARFAAFHELADTLFSGAPDRAGESERIDAHMRRLLARPAKDDPRISAINAALVDPAVVTVAELAEQAGISTRALERISPAAFGFTAKLLMRRQRFLRTLAQYMMDPSLKWLDTLDSHYFDQAHFIRDFRRFMGMTPNAYAKLPHPILAAATHARMAAAGEALQVLNRPPAAS